MKDIFLGKDIVCSTENIDNKTEKGKMIRTQLKQLLIMSQRDFAHYQMSLDPIKGKILKEEEEEIIEGSILCGKEEAIRLRNRFGDLEVSEIARKLGIIVEYKEKQSALDFVYFGLFESPNNILIYDGNIKLAVALLEELNINNFQVDFKDIVLAHEILHFIEEHDKSLYSNTRKVRLWSLGKLYTHSSKLICTGEIAAMSFSRTLLNLEFDPNILDYIFLSAFDFEKADKLFHRMMKFRSSSYRINLSDNAKAWYG